MELIISVLVRGRRAEPRSARSRHRHRLAAAGLAPCGRRDFGMDRAGDGRPGFGQQGRQDRSDRRGNHRRRERSAEVHQGAHRTARARPGRRHRARRWRSDDLRADQQSERKRPAANGIHRDSAELPGAGVGVRRPAGSGAAVGRRRLRDLGLDGGAARDHVRHRRIDIRAESERRLGACARYRLHIADRQPLSGRTGRRIGAGRGADTHHGDRRTDRAVLGVDGCAVDDRDGDLPDVLPEVVRLCGHRRCDVRGRCRRCGGTRGDRAARRSAGLAGCSPPAPARIRAS